MTTFVSDSFTGADNTELSAYNANWSKQTGHGTPSAVIKSNAANTNASDGGQYIVYQRSESPSSADYSVFSDLTDITDTVAWQAGVIGRASTGADTFYAILCINVSGTSDTIRLYHWIAGTPVQIGSNSTVSFAGTKNLELRMAGTAISVLFDTVAKCGSPVTDANIAGPGKAGILLFNASTTGGPSSLDNFSGVDGGGAAAVVPQIMYFRRQAA